MWRQNGDHLDWPLGLGLQSWIPFPQRTTLTQLNVSEICFLHGFNSAMIPKGLVRHLGGFCAKPYRNKLEEITQHWQGRLRSDTTSLSVVLIVYIRNVLYKIKLLTFSRDHVQGGFARILMYALSHIIGRSSTHVHLFWHGGGGWGVGEDMLTQSQSGPIVQWLQTVYDL